jgi:NAD(P) transhydrogenase subunit alpha
MSVLTVGVVAESAEGERRVALDPDAVARLVAKNRAVLVERGAGEAARFPDSSYTAAGATIASRRDVLASSDILAVVRPPDDSVVAALHRGQLLIGLLDPLNNLPAITALAAKDVTAASFEFLPRTLSRAQAMDALSSQSSTAGYRAAIVAAENFGRYFPMMITASGTARPAAVIVIGAGVAGLQALATAKRLGAVVTGYDVRAASRGEVESLGAEFMTSSISEGTGTGGYARAMTPEEQAAQQDELATALKKFDVIITTAKVPGHTPPQLVSAATLAAMSPGSVCVDLGASDKGGNVAGSRDGETIVTENGVIVVGAGQLASDLPTSSSQMYARNVVAMIDSLTVDDAIAVDPTDDVHAGVVVCHGGEIMSARVRTALGLDPLGPDHPDEARMLTGQGASSASGTGKNA